MRLQQPRIAPLQESEWNDEQRELAILRIGHLYRTGYEFHPHTRVGKATGLPDEQIEK